MKEFRLRAWSAWSPGIESEDDWRRWLLAPELSTEKSAPRIDFVPALLRRRCDSLARMMLHVAEACCGELRSEVASVFASRQGPINTTVEILEVLAAETPISPARFTHSVHNTQSGLFSIWARNQNPSSSVVGGAETFSHAFLEAMGFLRSAPERPVFVAVGDERYPEPLASIADHPHASHALGLLLTSDGEGTAVRFGLEDAGESSTTCEDRSVPDALAFVRWWLSSESSLRVVHGPRAWTWSR